MKRTFVAVLMYCIASIPVHAAPVYTGVQIDDTSTGILFGYLIDKNYAVELHYSESDSNISHAGINVDTKSASTGVIGIARFHMKLREVLPYYLFVKAGYVHTTNTETYSIPASVTLTLPYSDKASNSENQLILGGGAEYNFTKKLAGRMGLDLQGTDRSINLAAIYKF